MMHSAFFFSLLAGTAVAQYGATYPNPPAGGSKPAPSITTPAGYGPTPVPNPTGSLLPIPPIVSIISSALEAIPSGLIPDNDQPAPFESVYIPVSELFNSRVAPAFTETAKVPLLSINPVYSTTLSSSVVGSTEASKPATSTTCTESKAQSTRVPLDATSSKTPVATPTAKSSKTATSTVPTAKSSKPATSTTCTKSKLQSTRVPLGATASAGLPQRPTGTGSAVSASKPTGTSMSSSGIARPTATGGPDYFHGGNRPQGGFGWGRPRPSGMWPHGYPKPTRAAHRPSKPSAASGYGGVKASSTPCTLETRVRPKATGHAR